MLPIYRAIVLNPIVSVMSASTNNGDLGDWQLQQLDTPAPLFDVNQQVSLLENAGYNVYVLYRYDKVHLISAILPAGSLTHFQWIMAFSEHWGMSAY